MKLKLVLLMLIVSTIGCKKDFLEVRSNKRAFVPSSLEDYQQILDNTEVFCVRASTSIIVNTSDDFYITDAGWAGLSATEKNAYIWSSNAEDTYNYWASLYTQVFYANVVLDGLLQMKASDQESHKGRALKGAALFYRSFAYYNLAQLFTKPYIVGTNGMDPGVPLRLTADVDAKYPRGTIAQLYEQIMNDFNSAVSFLPDNADYKTRPTKAAAYAMLARTNLAIGAYADAEITANKALQIRSSLLRYELIDPKPRRPFPLALPNSNDEIIWYAAMSGPFMRSTLTYADSLLYQSYESDDQRKTLFFLNQGGHKANFRGSYSGNTSAFTGLAVDELYLIRAECLARRGETSLAMADLNALLVTRWKKDKFTPLQANDANDALNLILIERRKELIGRGTRWSDLRRLNCEINHKVTQVRNLQGKQYVLSPDDLSRYIFLIPQDEITLTGIAQN